MRVLQYRTKECCIYRIWFTDKLIKYDEGTAGGLKYQAELWLGWFLNDTYSHGFKELSPEEVENLKIEQL